MSIRRAASLELEGYSGGRGLGGKAVAAADYPPIRHKNNFLIYEESLRGGYWAPRLAGSAFVLMFQSKGEFFDD